MKKLKLVEMDGGSNAPHEYETDLGWSHVTEITLISEDDRKVTFGAEHLELKKSEELPVMTRSVCNSHPQARVILKCFDEMYTNPVYINIFHHKGRLYVEKYEEQL